MITKPPMCPCCRSRRGQINPIANCALCFVLFGVTLLPYALGFSGLFYASGAALLGGVFVALCVSLALASQKPQPCGGMTFAYSIFYLFLLFVLLPTDRVMGL